MAENPKITIASETWRHLKAREFEEAGDILRHEGLKKAIEHGLYLGGSHPLGRAALELLTGEDYDHSRLATNIGSVALGGPVGVAAGWDKTGKTIRGWQTLGANHITPGGVTFYGQPGNRMVRLRTFDNIVGDHGKSKSLNSYGFSSIGVRPFVYNIQRQMEEDGVDIPLFIQVTLNKEMYEPGNQHMIPSMIAQTVKAVKPVASGINLGLSSPNTWGMRDSQTEEFMYVSMATAKEVAGDDIDVGYKIDADGGESRLEQFCRAALRSHLNYAEGINTTGLEHIKAKYGADKLPGGLAGADEEYMQMAVNAVRYIYEAIGNKVDIMAMGGAGDPEQALRLIRAGGSAIGINTGIRMHGPKTITVVEGSFARAIPEGRVLQDIIGADTSRGPKSNLGKGVIN